MKKILSDQQIQSYRNMFGDQTVAMEFLEMVETLQQIDALSQIMGIEEASRKWGLEASTIRKMCMSGQIKARKIGDTWLMAIDTERPNAQRDLFVWEDYVLASASYHQDSVNRFKDLDIDRELESLVHKIKRLKDNRVKGDNRRSIKANVVDQLQKLSIYIYATIGGDKDDRKQKLIEMVNEKLVS